MEQSIYLLPGRGGRLDKGLGEALTGRGWKVYGRELEGEFQRLRFDHQAETIAGDLRTHFWHENARVVANSFGAYLFLHAQALLPPFPGRVLLLSPIVGEVSQAERMLYFVPPRVGQLQELIGQGAYPTPVRCEIHVGEYDWQSVPANVQEIGRPLGWQVSIVPEAGHQLPKAYVGAVLNEWFGG